MKVNRLFTVLLSSAGFLGVSNAAFAQTTDSSSTAGSATEELVEIVVTGSRLITNGNSAPTPVTLVTTEELMQRAPSSIPDALNLLPQFAGSGSPARNTYNLPASNQTGNNLNLRNLGPQRVLTLLDGARLVPSASTGLVDSSLIPQMLIQRVDVVTGGASAAYGSDAVSGVVNFVLNKKFNGMSYVVQGGEASRGDYGSGRIGLAAGSSFLSGKLHVEGSAEYYTNDGIRSINDRPYGDQNWSSIAILPVSAGVAGTAANPFVTLPYVNGTNIGYGGYLYRNAAGVNSGVLFQPGTTQVAQTGTAYAASAACVNCNTATNDTAKIVLIPKIQTDQYFGRADYSMNDNVSVFAQGYYGHSYSAQNTGVTISRSGATALSIFSGNAYLPANQQAAMTTAGLPNFLMSRISRDLGTNSSFQDGKSYGITLGAEGTLFDRFKWDFSVTHGSSDRTVTLNQVNNVRLRAAVDAVTDTSGNVVCRVSITNPGLYPGCVPINLFGEGSPSAAAVAYVRGAAVQTATYKQDVAEASIRGDLFALPAGLVSAAIGIESKKQQYDQTSNSDPAVFVAPVGIRGFSGLQYVTGNFGVGGGTVRVNEAFAEVLVPILKDQPFAKTLDFNSAFRYTNYSTSGGVNTWKIGAVWKPVDDFHLRVTKSRDIRAPTLVELFQGKQTANNGGFTDPHIGNVGINFVQITSGNPKLEPENADTITLGVVFEPTFINGFTASVDYYRIKVSNAIAGSPYTIQQLLNTCEASGGTDVTCTQITRPLPFSDHSAANAATAISLAPLNVSQTTLSGYDVEVNYNRSLFAGKFNVRALVTLPQKFDSQVVPGTPVLSYLGNMDAVPSSTQANSVVPKYHGTLSLGYATGPISVKVDEELISKMRRSDQQVYVGVGSTAPAYAYTNLFVGYDVSWFGSNSSLFLNVANVFDKQAPLLLFGVAGSSYPTNRTLYDVVGRAYTFGIRGKF
jgi:outer membrane receptor protein involved in Fe transport